ncbi:hypothetical protein ACRAQ6_13940 [Erythrobacter sp. HA6-11]
MSGAVTKVLEIGSTTYRMVFKFGTLRMAEKELGENIASVFSGGGEKVGFDVVNAVFWASLQPAHRVTREKADDLIDEAGLEAVMAQIAAGVAEYFGDDDADASEHEGNDKPAKKAGKSKS